jgi:hypothetical protein
MTVVGKIKYREKKWSFGLFRIEVKSVFKFSSPSHPET